MLEFPCTLNLNFQMVLGTQIILNTTMEMVFLKSEYIFSNTYPHAKQSRQNFSFVQRLTFVLGKEAMCTIPLYTWDSHLAS